VWRKTLEHVDRPVALALSRQNLPVLDPLRAANTVRGGYILEEAASGAPSVILIATGSEVGLAISARERLEAAGTPTRVVSMPCVEWFHAQDAQWREQVLPRSVRARVSVEAAVGMGWRDLVGDAGEIVSIEHFGASADGAVLFEHFGFTTDRVVEAAEASLRRTEETI
jgi:transketolase